jgi:hypothetical protein
MKKIQTVKLGKRKSGPYYFAMIPRKWVEDNQIEVGDMLDMFVGDGMPNGALLIVQGGKDG